MGCGDFMASNTLTIELRGTLNLTGVREDGGG